jgi:hypothetical protein
MSEQQSDAAAARPTQPTHKALQLGSPVPWFRGEYAEAHQTQENYAEQPLAM